MTTFTENFTQGGQTQLHKLRMLKQVMGATFKVSLWLSLLVLCLLVYMDHSSRDFWLIGVYLKAWFMTNCPPLLANLSPTNVLYLEDGSAQLFSDTMIINSGYVVEQMEYFMWSGVKKLIQALLVGIVGSGLVSWFWIVMGRKKQETKILSGFELVEPKLLTKRIFANGASPYKIANVPMPKNAEFQHMMITGTTGSGKSNAIHQLLSQIRANGDQAIVVDTTGGIFSRFYEENTDILLNPLDERSHHWNLWGEVVNDYVLDEITEAIIPENKSFDSFWTQSARQVLGESIRYLIGQGKESYQELVNMCLQIPLKELKKRLDGTSVSAIVDPAIDKTALSVRASLANNLRVFQHLPDAKGGISLLNFMQENLNTWMFLSCLPNQREFLRPIFSSQLSLMIKGLMRRAEQGGTNKESSRTWIIIDELASLNKLPALLLGLAEIRKYGGCFVLGFQDLSQLEEIYGSQATKTLSNLTGTKLLFRSIDTDVAMRVARYLGEQEKQEANESISFGAHQMRDGVNLSSQKQTKAVVTASQIMMLKDLEAYLKFPQDLPITKVQFKYLEIKNRAPAFVERLLKRHGLLAKPTSLNDDGVDVDTRALPVINFNQPEQIPSLEA